MQAPEFWQHRGIAALALSPLGGLVGLAGSIRRSLIPSTELSVPVVCVGNVTIGGTGKTPVVAALARVLQGGGRVPHILSRGYGGTLPGPLRVDPARHTARDVGDEPLLHARIAPTWIGGDRVKSGLAAIGAGADILLMDDGFQNPGLAKTVSILVTDGGVGFGNGCLMPAGPLRESLSGALARADAVVILGEDISGAAEAIAGRCPVFEARIVPVAGTDIAGKRVFAFAGIGRPEKFYATLRDMGCTLAGTRDFADHHAFSSDEVVQIVDAATKADALPVTTEKDFVRLPEEARQMIRAVRIAIEWADPDAPDRLLQKALALKKAMQNG